MGGKIELTRGHVWALVLALALAIVAHLNVPQGGFVYDDEHQIVENHLIRSPQGLAKGLVSDVWAFKGEGAGTWSNYYRPGFVAWMFVNHTLFGLEPAAWHVLNLAIHLLAVWLAFLLLVRLRFPLPVVAASSWVFAVHPAHVESVTWLAGSTDVLMACFVFGCLLAHISRWDADTPSSPRWLAPLLLLAALTFKETAAMVPLLIAIVETVRSSREGGSLAVHVGKGIRASLPTLAAVLIFGALRTWVLHGSGVETTGTFGLATVLLTIPKLAVFYLRQVFVPIEYSPIYAFEPVHPGEVGWANFGLPGLILIGFLFATWKWMRLRVEHVLLMGLALLLLLPAFDIRLFKHEQYIRDRYLYIALLGVVAMTFDSLRRLLATPCGPARSGAATAAAGFAAALALAAVTFEYNRVWLASIPLWERSVQTAPASGLAWTNLSEAYRDAGRLDEAVDAGRRATEVAPRFDNGHLVLGMALQKLGQSAEAEHQFRFVLERGSEVAIAVDQLAALYAGEGRVDEAIAVFEEGARRMPPSRPKNLLNVAVLQFNAGRAEDATRTLESLGEALDSPNPSIARGWHLLGELYRIQHRPDDAARCYRRYLQFTAGWEDEATARLRAEAADRLRALE